MPDPFQALKVFMWIAVYVFIFYFIIRFLRYGVNKLGKRRALFIIFLLITLFYTNSTLKAVRRIKKHFAPKDEIAFNIAISLAVDTVEVIAIPLLRWWDGFPNWSLWGKYKPYPLKPQLWYNVSISMVDARGEPKKKGGNAFLKKENTFKVKNFTLYLPWFYWEGKPLRTGNSHVFHWGKSWEPEVGTNIIETKYGFMKKFYFPDIHKKVSIEAMEVSHNVNFGLHVFSPLLTDYFSIPHVDIFPWVTPKGYRYRILRTMLYADWDVEEEKEGIPVSLNFSLLGAVVSPHGGKTDVEWKPSAMVQGENLFLTKMHNNEQYDYCKEEGPLNRPECSSVTIIFKKPPRWFALNLIER